MTLRNGKHYLPSKFLSEEIDVLVIGAGGSGSHMVSDLAVLHQSLLDLGHPCGLNVTVIDDDVVSSANVGRARFYESDCGLNKAVVLTNRINMCFGFSFEALTSRYTEWIRADIIIGCVDTRESRRVIWSANSHTSSYWLDLGNSTDDGQVILGQFKGYGKSRLPCVVDLFPEMLDSTLDPADSGPSCSRADALSKQSAFVNKTAALHGINMLFNLFKDGYIDYHAAFFSNKTGRSNTLSCDPETWSRFGYCGTN